MDPVAPRGSPVPPAGEVPGQQGAPATVAANLPAATAAALGLVPGNTVDAQVLSALSAGRFLLAIGGRQVVAESASELRPGAKVRLDVTANDANGVFLRLVEPVRSDTSTPAQRLTQAGLPPTSVAAAVLAAFEDAGAPLDPRRLQAAVIAATQPKAPAATAAAHAALALAGLPATPALVALASRAVTGGTPNLAAAVQDLQRAVAAEPAVRSGGPATVARPGPERGGTPIPPIAGTATSSTPGPERPSTAPAAPTTPLVRTPTAPMPMPAAASPDQLRTAAATPLLPAASTTGTTTPPIVMAPLATAGNAVRPGQAVTIQVAAASTVDAAPRTSVLLATAHTGPATGPRPSPTAVGSPASLPTVPATPAVSVAPEPTPSPPPPAAVATPLVNRPNAATPALPTTAAPPAALVAPAASVPATAPIAPAASPPGAVPVIPAASSPANPPGPEMARPAPTAAPSPIPAGAPATPAAPTPAVMVAPTAVPPPAIVRTSPANEVVPRQPAATPVERPVMTRDQALLLLSRMSLPDPEQDGAPAVARALQLAGVHPRAAVAGTQAEPTEQPLARHLAALSAPAPAAEREAAPIPSPPAPGTPALAAATTHAARESFAEQVFKPKEFADYDRVVPLPLAAQQVPTPARLAIASRSVGGGAQATFLRVDAELDRLGPVSVRVSGVSGGPLAITLISRPGAGGPLVEDLPDLVADLHKLGIEAGVRIAEDPAHG